jgi:hypothetical protein
MQNHSQHSAQTNVFYMFKHFLVYWYFIQAQNILVCHWYLHYTFDVMLNTLQICLLKVTATVQ